MKTISIRGLQVSRMTLGTVQLGMAYGVANRTGQPSRETAFEMLRGAREAGINSLDTARAYGSSEEVIGAYLAAYGGEAAPPVITTKFKLARAEGGDDQPAERQIRRSVEISLEKLGVPHLPILMSHAAQDLHAQGDAIADALVRLRREGLIRLAGASVYNAEDLVRVLDYDIFEAVQIPMNIFDPRIIRSGILDRLAERRMLVFVRSVFLQGLFFLSPDALPPYYAMAREPIRALQNLSAHTGLSIAHLAAAYIRDLPGVTSLVLGAETPDQVRANAALLDVPPLDGSIRMAIERIADSVPIEDVMKEIMQESSRKQQDRKQTGEPS